MPLATKINGRGQEIKGIIPICALEHVQLNLKQVPTN
ncbi:hypothetical protein B6N60_02964 [Richelia sinica FACHB-800]|uniref:Uncharacterized protein n=1 Tax=Richelia sinica FACHB-800 TaxID=1357546 RepID=A0A975T990_9NOST|nr:hypothetical protein B6N60_02964 [Richelia sinica FACHB-800]